MKIGNGYSITFKDGDLYSDFNDSHTMSLETDPNRIRIITDFYNLVRSNKATRVDRFDLYKATNTDFQSLFNAVVAEATEAVAQEVIELTDTEKVTRGIQNIMNFFTEFNFEPNFRFMNTLAHYLEDSKKSAKGYISRYFELINSPYSNVVAEKLKSQEMDAILDDLKIAKTEKIVNKRFKIYYGSQGTGKTTQALKETSGKCIVCHSAMLPSDLMEDFKFNDGKAEFQPSELYRAMVEGRPIVFDEINLLPFESLRFLQGILDGKDSLIYKGNEVKIADGFMIIGTMNLTVNGMTYGLPEPLIDRCAETKKFNLTAENLLSALQ